MLLVCLAAAALSGGAENKLDVTHLDCGFRKLALAKAKVLQPFRDAATFDAISDGLELGKLCAGATPKPVQSDGIRANPKTLHPLLPCEVRYFVDAKEGNDGSRALGNEDSPFQSVERALTAARASASSATSNCEQLSKTIVLAAGIHYLNKTLVLGAADSHTSFVAKGDGMPWLSGGAPLMAAETPWKKVNGDIYATSIPKTWTDVAGLFSLDPVKVKANQHARFTRARYPNSDPEIDTWGYASLDRANVCINASAVMEWHKPAAGKVPTFEIVDLSVEGNPSGYIKNDSTMAEYNTWTSGHGGVCDTVWNKGSPSYWCSSGAAGGWANVDAACATAGQLNLPVGMTINTSFAHLSRFANWKNPKGAIIHTWHSQSWATHMFRVAGHAVDNEGSNANVTDGTAAVLGAAALAASKSISLTFSSGGQQGGRNWCRCDQCGYAGPWCGQHQSPPVPDDRLISGDWFVEGVREELDVPGEYHYDSDTRMLYYWPNSTSTASKNHPVEDLVVPQLKTLVRIDGGAGASAAGTTTGASFTGIGFRDSVATYMEPEWSAPSGGDWSLYHGGAFEVTNAANITVKGCTFRRLDGNAIYLAGKSRDVKIEQNVFEWLGENAVATNGDAEKWDARKGEQPRGTVMKQNLIHDVGIYEKQSSGWGHNKACLATVEDNIMYNLPRAAINFNDALGGGNLVSNNLLWNTCRESGDHGAINSWDRMPFLHDLHESGTPSFTPLPTTIANNFIFANYGSSQGVDNDDGSSHFNTHDNVFYMADGFKMDYGGHDSAFHSNLVINYPYDGQNCVNIGGFLRGHGDGFYNNTCLVGVGGMRKPSGCGDPSCFVKQATDLDNVGGVSQCDPDYVSIGNNTYYSPNGNATLNCGGKAMSIPEVQKQHGIELGSTFDTFPTDAEIIQWAQDRLGMPAPGR